MLQRFPTKDYTFKPNISDKQLRVMFELLDANSKIKIIFLDSGDLEFDEVFGVLKKRSFYSQSSDDVRICYNP
jgi:hypothetical protein